MKTLAALVLATLAGVLSSAAQLPYPLWRTVGGTNYNLQPLYAWRSDMVVKAATRQSTDDLEKQRPYADWIGANFWEHFTVKEAHKPELLLMEWQSARGRADTTEIVVQHYPRSASVTEGQRLELFACPMGHRTWTNQSGVVKTLPLFDYGTCCPSAQRIADIRGKHGGA